MENLGFVYINLIGISETDLQLPTLSYRHSEMISLIT